MVACFLCGSNESISSGGGFRQLHGLQCKSSDSMKCFLNNLIIDSGITACDKDVVCLHCEVLCRELDAMEYERLVMRKIMRRLIHCTYRVNNLDRAWCQLDHKALGQFKLNGTCYQCKKCDFKTKRFAHITPHHTYHQIQDRKELRIDKMLPSVSQGHSSKRHNVSPEEQVAKQPSTPNLEPERVAPRNEIFEFNIDSHEGDCLYSMEEVSVKCVDKEKNDDYEYDLYYPEDCDDDDKKTEFALQGQDKAVKRAASKQTREKPSDDCAKRKPDKRAVPTKCRRLEYLYALHCGCSHCEQRSTNFNCDKTSKKKHNTTHNVCEICNQHFPEDTSFAMHTRWCRIKSALKEHANSMERVLVPKNEPTLNKCSNKNNCPDDYNDHSDEDDDFYDLGAVNVEDVDINGEMFDEKFELFLRKTMMRLNTIDIEFVPI